MPDLGDEASDERAVDGFYAYWVRFESWRNFDLEMREHDPDAADDRYEKRYMKKENAKLAAKRKREEMERIIALVERARANDPRLKKFADARAAAKREAKDARQRAARDKELAAQAAADAVAAEKARALALKAGADKAAKDDRVKLKKAKRRAEKQLQKVNAAARDAGREALSELDFLKIMEDLEPQLCVALAERLGGEEAAVLAELADFVVCGVPKTAEPVKKIVKLSSGPKVRAPWSEGEIKMLDKACKRFKAGSMNRWEQVADYLNSQMNSKNPRTHQECISQFQKPLVDPKEHAKKLENAEKPPPPPVVAAAEAAARRRNRERRGPRQRTLCGLGRMARTRVPGSHRRRGHDADRPRDA